MHLKKNYIFLFFVLYLVFFVVYSTASAQTATSSAADLQQKISDRNAQIQELEQQLNLYNKQASDVGKQANTLQSTLKTLDLTQKKINTDLSLTQNKITVTGRTISKINAEIQTAKDRITKNKQLIGKLLQGTAETEGNNSTVALILASKNIAEAWTDVENINQIQNEVKKQTDQLHILQTDLEDKQNNLTSQKKQLTGLQQDLVGKKEAVLSTAQQKAELLAQTKNQQATYAKLIAATEAQKAQFEQDVFNFESQLNLVINKNSYPVPQHNILSWPLDNVLITQLFGKTVGASKLYVSGSHNGVDFRASIGTRVKNVLAGTVVGTGNTDIYPGCYSFGKWVMVKHDNGLSTIYGHLSVISVSKGQQLGTGDLIGYSGNTGYSTGPHLHISVYATEGVRIEQFVNSRGCKQAIIPLADVKAYLDPMVYFPQYAQN